MFSKEKLQDLTKDLPKHLNAAKHVTLKCAKYGATFFTGVLVGTICGVALFFKLSEENDL